jgi:hypothetical protein
MSLGTEFNHIWSGEGQDPWVGRAEAGFALTTHLVLAAGFDAPLAGEERFENRARLSLGWQLGRSSDTEEGDPTCICH